MAIDLREIGKSIEDTSSKVADILLRKYLTEQEIEARRAELEKQLEQQRLLHEANLAFEKQKLDTDLARRKKELDKTLAQQRDLSLRNDKRQYKATLMSGGLSPEASEWMTRIEFAANPLEKQVGTAIMLKYNELISKALQGKTPTQEELNQLPPDLRTSFWKDYQKHRLTESQIQENLLPGFRKDIESDQKLFEDIEKRELKQRKGQRKDVATSIEKINSEIEKLDTAIASKELQLANKLSNVGLTRTTLAELTSGIGSKEEVEKSIKKLTPSFEKNPEIPALLNEINRLKSQKASLEKDYMQMHNRLLETTGEPEGVSGGVNIMQTPQQASKVITSAQIDSLVNAWIKEHPEAAKVREDVRQTIINDYKEKGYIIQ